jgi:histidine ammonia-lyase
MDEPVTVTAEPMGRADAVRVARGAPVHLSDDARAVIRRSRAVLDGATATQQAVYGLNTGLGHLKDTQVDDEALDRYQATLVALHDGGVGEPMPTEIVRAAMFVRVAGMARGGSGATPAIPEALVAMLNAGVHPVVPSVGSVGASDLMHMAAIGCVVIGRGKAELDGEVLPGGEALRRAGIEPVSLGPKDGLALVSANGVAIGHGALVVERLLEVVATADVVAATALEAYRGNPSIVDVDVAAAKPIAGQHEAAANLRRLLEGSELFEPGGPRSVQDPLSFRVIPQVHGALRELVDLVDRAVADELASRDDNPLVIEDGRVVSTGNFHPMLLALAFDAVRPALAHVGLLSDRRMEHLWAGCPDPALFALGEPTDAVRAAMGLMTRYSAAALLADLRQLAAPATLDLPPLDIGVEDHGTSAPLTVERTEQAVDRLESILVVELLLARTLMSTFEEPPRLGSGPAAALATLDEVLDALPEDARPMELHAALRRHLTGIRMRTRRQTGSPAGAVGA